MLGIATAIPKEPKEYLRNVGTIAKEYLRNASVIPKEYQEYSTNT